MLCDKLRMKLTNIIEIEVINTIAGEDVIELVSFLKDKKNISEFVIAETLEREINTIRNMLYRLMNANLVSFTRKKDKQKGWYIYYWTYSDANIFHLYWEIKKKNLEHLKSQLLKEESTVFFSCPTGCIRLDFDKAIEFDYLCPECGELLMQQDTSQRTKKLKSDIAELEKIVQKKPKTILSFEAKAEARKSVKQKEREAEDDDEEELDTAAIAKKTRKILLKPTKALSKKKTVAKKVAVGKKVVKKTTTKKIVKKTATKKKVVVKKK